MTTDRLHVAG